MTVSHVELIKRTAERSGYYDYEVVDVLNAYVYELKQAIIAGEKVFIRDIGAIETVERAPYKKNHVDIYTGIQANVIIPGRKLIRLKITNLIKDIVNGKKSKKSNSLVE